MLLSRKHLIPFLPAHKRKITSDERGMVVAEFLIILPVLMLLMCAVVEFGWYFIRYEITTRVVSLTAAAVQNNASTLMQDDNTQATAFAAELQANATNTALPVINFSDGNSYVCATAYATLAEAQANLGCLINTQGNDVTRTGSGAATAAFVPHWYLTNPNAGTANVNTPYYVAIQAYAEPISLTGLVKNIIPQGTAIFTPSPTIVIVGSNSSSSVGAWIAVPPMAVFNGGANANIGYTAETVDTTITPDGWCQQNGYNYATGMCRGNNADGTNGPNGTMSFQGPLVTNTLLGREAWSCMYGNVSFAITQATQIHCN